MAILAFQKPEKVIMLEESPTHGTFEFRPLEPGFGTTVGNALRRILLSSLEGFAINTIRISGVEHEFSTVPGVREDVTNIILNLKQVRFKQLINEYDTAKVSLTIENTTEFKAGDINKGLTGFEVLNPDLVICHIDPKAKMQIDLTINKGRGYVATVLVSNGTLHDITTDGSIHPKDALKEAARILIYHFGLFSDEKMTFENSADDDSLIDEVDLRMRKLLKSKLTEMKLSVRALNCLAAANVETLGDLVKYNKNDLLTFRNFGKKSLSELDALLTSLNLSFGMDISKYKLEKEEQ